MSPLRNLLADVAAKPFRLAVLLGATSIPITVWMNWVLTPKTAYYRSEVAPVFVACVISGYLYRSRVHSSSRAGTITGFVGSVPVVLWQSTLALLQFLNYPPVVKAPTNTVETVLISVGVALLTAVILMSVLVAVSSVGGRIGGWLAERVDEVSVSDSNV
ncbi:hypothetical protein AUR64_14735 [Haloprofundus marisrubri]|uniref:Uncharacterized protein n=1 Tax=Haloprofundus marisrubri TaxID=1514971 RepID=A0A0W1R6Y4_9EURY|nr:DUF5518 domain-containing protein [Haloprofundus marisrubri]KTG09055.1 hypothetical protein AUR64_14735 [Haloprofundus marisrubri]